MSTKRDSGGKRMTAAFDLDGTLAEYSGWTGWRNIGPPRDGCVELLEAFVSRGWTIIIHTTRADVNVVWDWVDEHLPDLVHYVNVNPDNISLRLNPGKPIARVYFDDRAWPYCGKGFPTPRELLQILTKTNFFDD